MKACSKCGVVKALGEFSRSAKVKDGRRSSCKACDAAQTKRHRAALGPEMTARRARHWAANKEKLAAVNAAWYAANRERAAAKKAAARKADLDAYRARDAAWRKNNPAKVAAAASKRRADVLRATPRWANLRLVELYYQMAKMVSDATGVPHEVDHIVALRGRRACGLHCEFNLQVLPASINRRKYNREIEVAGLR